MNWQHISKGDVDPKEWARVLRVRHESGENLCQAQIDAYRAALGITMTRDEIEDEIEPGYIKAKQKAKD